MEPQQSYEKSLVYHLVIFLRAMEQYNRSGQQAIDTQTLGHNAHFLAGMRRLLGVMRTCGERFLALPDPPQGALEADGWIRSLGQELGLFANCLEELQTAGDAAQREKLHEQLKDHIRRIREDYRRFTELYEEAYPGRLSAALRPPFQQTKQGG